MKTTVNPIGKVIEAVIGKQGEMSDKKFAEEKLGLTSVMWFYLKTGQRIPGKKTYASIMRAFPDLIPLCLMEMTERRGN